MAMRVPLPIPLLVAATACSIVGDPASSGQPRADAGAGLPGDGSPSGDDGVGASCAPALATVAPRGGDAPVLVRDSYDYVPSVMHDGVYRMWWCGGVAGDFILHAEADRLDGPWHARGSDEPGTFDVALQPTGAPGAFDGTHVCDPSVVRVDGVYYMYYGGYPTEDGPDSATSIGVARSDDGLSWDRLHGGQPIVTPARAPSTVSNRYGAGQPTVVHLDGLFYLSFTDTTGLDVDGNGGGQFVLRSPDPTFQSEVEELLDDGFAPYAPASHTTFALVHSVSVDWQYVDAIDAFAIAIDGIGGQTEVRFFDRDLRIDLGSLSIAGTWTEGPGLVSRPDRHAIPSTTCGVVALDVVRSVGGADTGTWELAHVGADLDSGLTCACTPEERIYEGAVVVAPGRPPAFVVDGGRLRVERAAVRARLGLSVIEISPAVYDAIPYRASLTSGAEVLGAGERPAAFHLDDGRLWPVDCLEAITDNDSEITYVSQTDWDTIEQASSLRCLR